MKEAVEALSPMPIGFIRDRFLEKRKTNPQYSIAAYARDLGVSPSFLSRLLAGDRPLTVKLAVQIATIFDLSSATIDEWVSHVIAHSSKNAKIPRKLKEKLSHKTELSKKYPVQYYEMERFRAISQWYHLAILSLVFVEGFKPSSTWIAKRLGITRMEAQDALNRLLELGLLEKKDNTLKPTKNMLFVNQKSSDLSIRQYHQQMCDKAKEALQDSSTEAFEQQYFSGLSLACDRSRIPEFKEKLRAVSQEMMKMTVGNTYSDVYHLNIQFFPVTKNKKDKSYE